MNRFFRIFTDALSVFFNNTSSSVTSSNVQGAIQELDTNLQNKPDIGSNISTFNNDAGYITLQDIPASDVQSVNGETGVVVIDADNIDDTSTNNKFVTQSEKNTISNQSNVNTGDETLISIQSKRPIKTVGGQTLEGLGNIPFPTSNDVESITGDGVDNTDPKNPILSFPNADQVDDSSTVKKFITQAELDLITTNTNSIVQNATDIQDSEVIITQNTNSILNNTTNIQSNDQDILNLQNTKANQSDLDIVDTQVQSNIQQIQLNDNAITVLANSKVDSVTGERVDNTDPLNPVINLPKYVSLQAGLTRVGQTTIPLANQQQNIYEEYLRLDYPCTITDNYFISIAFKWSTNIGNTNALFRLALTDGTTTQFEEVRIEAKDTAGTGEVVNVIENGLIVGNINTGTDIRVQEYFPVDVILDAGKTYSVSLEFTHEGNAARTTIYSSTIRLEQKTQNL
jgi:hypothetical protein